MIKAGKIFYLSCSAHDFFFSGPWMEKTVAIGRREGRAR
jgi:hypothetical protein